MLIRNATAFIGGRFCAGMEVRVHNGRVQEIGQGLSNGLYEDAVDLAGDYLLPGFVECHIHACRGNDAMQGETAVRAMSRELFRLGVAAFLPTTMSAAPEDTRAGVAGIRRVMEQPEHHGALVLGTHMEAPFMAPERCGAQVKEHFCLPDMDVFMALCDEHPETVRVMTVAPELPGGEAFIRRAVQLGVQISVGHTNATAEEVHLAADWGATRVTHTFNAQTGLHHREPGVPGASLVDDRLYTEMICDGIHLHPDVVRLIVRAKGAARTVVITDAMEAAGMPEGQYALGGQTVYVKDGAARLTDGTLAGSVLTMRKAFENLLLWGIPAEDAVLMCTATPADSVGEKLAGRITAGAPAPLTRWSRDWRWKGILA
ncbi:MAG: N-acetylglucosamine-6-phosphate deacetylase [Clostridiales bacterium]|nr:N-acetylglucosamine-6-phosphate deacetylase [Clostridiales bacterium]